MKQETFNLGVKGTLSGTVPVSLKKGDTYEIVMGNPNHLDFIEATPTDYSNGDRSIVFVNKSDGTGTIIVNRVQGN